MPHIGKESKALGKLLGCEVHLPNEVMKVLDQGVNDLPEALVRRR
jgi:hypothetical protein